jgi:hypothetical protein
LEIIKLLIEEYRSYILEEHRLVELTTLSTRFHELAVESGDTLSSYTSQKLKRQLTKEWPEMSFIPQLGKSDLVCSSAISVGDALTKAN